VAINKSSIEKLRIFMFSSSSSFLLDPLHTVPGRASRQENE